MDDPGHLIAVSFLLLYAIFGPIVLLAIYVLFDVFARSGTSEHDRKDDKINPGHPAVWTDEDLDRYMQHR